MRVTIRLDSTLNCPDCHTANVIQQPPKKKRPAQVPSEDGYQLAPAESLGDAPPSADSYRVRCRTCEAVIYVSPRQTGQTIACPDCGTKVKVPLPPAPKPKVKLAEYDLDIGIAPPHELVQQVDNTAQLLSAVRAKVEQQQETRPQPPRRPFVDGVFGFPWQLSALPAVVVICFLSCLVVVLIQTISELKGKEQVVGIPLSVAAFMISAVITIVASVFWMTVINWTAMGYRKIENWPDFEIFGWLRTSLFFVNALAIGAVPSGVLLILLPSGVFATPLAMPFVFLLFPFFLLSMTDLDSPIGFYSRFIFDSLQQNRGAWSTFYAWSLLTWALGLLPFVGVILTGNLLLQYVGVCTIVFAVTIYCRLLGRLAWVIDNGPTGLGAADRERPDLTGVDAPAADERPHGRERNRRARVTP